VEAFVLSTPDQVVWALITYTDWWQPNTTSVYNVGKRRGSFVSDGIRDGLLDSLPERDELCRRMRRIAERDRRLLFLWYLRELPAIDIARELRISRRQCFRRRAAVIRRIVDLGEASVA
jgi:hypothetical protein